jgi:hypothetical protein
MSRALFEWIPMAKNLSANVLMIYGKMKGLKPQNEIQNTKTISSTTNKLNPNLKTENHMPFDFLDGNYSTHSIPDFGLIASLGTLLPITQGEDYEEQVFANQIKEKTKRNNHQRQEIV